MKIGDGDHIQFDDSEEACILRYRNFRQASSQREAAEMAFASMLPSNRTQEFVAYLSNGELRLTPDKRIVRVGAHRGASRTGPILRAEEAPSRDGRSVDAR